MSFRALVTDRAEDGSVSSAVRVIENAQLPQGNVLMEVDWAALNYKDGLCLTGAGGLVRTYPHVAGIDLAGTVSESQDPRYRPGDQVLLTGWRVGESHWGGYAERARVNADWLVPLPGGLSTREAAVVGTAGLTAMLAIGRLEETGFAPGAGPVLVTGAAGGVGSIAVSLLTTLGYEVTALSGRLQHAHMLKTLGAASVIERSDFLAEPDKVLEPARWAAAIDTVGGKVLGKLLRQVKYGGATAAVGNAGGIELETNVLPFILRGVVLLGIDSVMQPFAARVAAWRRIAETLDLASYMEFVEEISLEDVPQAARRILAGQVRGRVIVRPR